MPYYWKPYVPVSQRRAKAKKQIEKMRKKGKNIEPVEIEGRAIARSFWGKAWCDHLESFSDFENRLPRGRTYARNGSVCHLEILPGRIEAIVSGSELYNIVIHIEPLKKKVWNSIKKQCAGKIGTMLELLQGKLSDHVMEIVTDCENGLMPLPGEIKLGCNCPDWATMCKHVAAVMYGIGNRLDSQPELLFILRNVDASELISGDMKIEIVGAKAAKTISNDKLVGIFGDDIELDLPDKKPAKSTPKTAKKTKFKAKKKVVFKRKKLARKKKTVIKVARKIKLSKNDNKIRKQPSGKAIAMLRKQSGLSVPKFAQQLGISATSIYKWEKVSGKLKLHDSTLVKIEEFQKEMLE